MGKKLKISLLLVSIAAALAAVGIRYAYNQGLIRMNYPTYDELPIHGIDVSHHQSHIDWHKLDRKTVQFAFIKATEGVDHKDSLFVRNWALARQNNIVSGAYHYFLFCKRGEEQARNYIESVPIDSIGLPPIIDLEYGGNCKKENRFPNLMDEVAIYINIVEQHYNKRVIIYSTNEFYKKQLKYKFPNNPIWIRNILSYPTLPDGREWTFWQFTNRGRIDGIDTPVDLNAFNGSKDAFDRLRTQTIDEVR